MGALFDFRELNRPDKPLSNSYVVLHYDPKLTEFLECPCGCIPFVDNTGGAHVAMFVCIDGRG